MFSPGSEINCASYEIGPIRPPSEARSLLIRATRNCPWNRCKFCHTYKGEKFELRPVEDIKADIASARRIQDAVKAHAWKSGRPDSVREAAAEFYNHAPAPAVENVALWMNSGGECAFLQDANSLIMRTPELTAVLRSLREQLPSITRVTSYGRSHTAARKTPEELKEIHEAGLTRLHLGLESGYDRLLEYMDKGVTAAVHIAGGRKVVESGISLSEYVILGLGGKAMWREHALETARVINEIEPDFIRVRTLAINDRMPLRELIESGDFIRTGDEQIVEEERLFIENLDCRATFVSDHITNLLPEIEGPLATEKTRMLAAIERFLAMPPEERLNFRFGRRVGVYENLDDLKIPQQRARVEEVIATLRCERNLEETLARLTSRFI